MFDTTCANRRRTRQALSADGLPADCLLDGDSVVGGVVWEEHCVECGQPDCFRTCRMFERSYDGKCRRFDAGILPIEQNGRLLFDCSFRKWAKLEGRFSGALVPMSRTMRLSAVDRLVSRFVQAVNRLMSFLPGRIGAITVYRRLKLWASRFANRRSENAVGGLVLRCRSSRRVDLHLSVVSRDETVHDEVFRLDSSWQTFRTAFRPVGAGSRFLLFATDDHPFELLIETLEVVPEAVSSRGLSGVPKESASPAPFVKCLAWDLDNTLWKGILTEDGPDGIAVNEAAVSLVKTLDSRGILNTICSKNDYAPTWEVLKRLSLADYFVFPSINWGPKSEGLKAIAKAINIGLDAVAFIDDSPFERGEVSTKLPMVRVFRNTEVEDLARRPEFNPPVSAESAGRRLSYQREMQRVAAFQSFDGDYESFLKDSEIVLTLFPLRDADVAVRERCYELVQRTNQLTLAGRRYEPEQFERLVLQEGVKAYGVRCHDRFGDYGIVGVVILREAGKAAVVEEFVMSCRVAKKQCEYAVVRALAERALAEGAETFEANVVATGRNGALIAAFDEMPFRKSAVGEKAIRYELALKGACLPAAIDKAVFA